MGQLLFMHYLDMHTVAIYATRLTFEHFRGNVFIRFLRQSTALRVKRMIFNFKKKEKMIIKQEYI